MRERSTLRWLISPLLALACLLAASGRAGAEDLPPMNSHLQLQLRYLRIRLIGGRIQVTTLDPTRSSNSSTRNEDRQERLSLSYDSGLVTLAYEMSTPATQITINVTDGSEVIVRRVPPSGLAGPHVELIQPADGPLSLRVGTGEQRRDFHAETLWHLLLAEPQLCSEQLVPVLELIRPDWRLTQTRPLVEAVLRRSAVAFEPHNRRQLAALVTALGSDQFARREAAQRELRTCGQVILPFLRGVDRSRLDVEQAFRLRGVIDALGNEDIEDTPDRVANWLAGDPHAWYWLLARDELAVRQIAARQLARLLEMPLDFDPTADAATRQAQLKTIAEQIEQVWRF